MCRGEVTTTSIWNATLYNDPLHRSFSNHNHNDHKTATTTTTNAKVNNTNDTVFSKIPLHSTYITLCTCPMKDFWIMAGNNDDIQDINDIVQCHRVAQIALADFIARLIASNSLVYENSNNQENQITIVKLEPLDRATSSSSRTRNNCGSSSYYTYSNNKPTPNSHTPSKRSDNWNTNSTPYILERSDVAVIPSSYELRLYLRAYLYSININEVSNNASSMIDDNRAAIEESILQCMNQFTTQIKECFQDMMKHIAIALFQDNLRSKLHSFPLATNSNTVLANEGVVAFIANGAILPRKSGASSAPMSSPPAIPFAAPESSIMNQTIPVDMGSPILTDFLRDLLPSDATVIDRQIISISGLVIPRGVSLIVGGGYHGKSTLLRCVAAGVYNKTPYDGRELCVTVADALTIRAEDGRYVNNCNVSAFISNLPTPDLDTKFFSTAEASGSTSQASNVVEAIEMGVSAMLVDEDVSAANFMARDGRMRSLVMDESITPLLYRVNGLYRTHGISSIVVVGGVGDWLDVPDNVILMDRYRCFDATAKARSISKQFSHGHVQYAGRGVVHRLDWEKGGTPLPRRPSINGATKRSYDVVTTSVTLLGGSNSIAVNQLASVIRNDEMIDDHDVNEDANDDERYIDLSRCEQLLGKKPQLYGCGLCVAWLLAYSQQHPEYGIRQLLEKMDEKFDQMGWMGIIQGCRDKHSADHSAAWTAAVEKLGFVLRPRRLEVGQALTRFRGLTFEMLPFEDDGSEEAEKLEAERKRNELLAIWNNRRKRNPE